MKIKVFTDAEMENAKSLGGNVFEVDGIKYRVIKADADTWTMAEYE